MRPARALIDLQALRHNYRLARDSSGGRALAVIKADAYGHGAVHVAQALEAQADGFAVACIEEALELRAAGIRAPILLLEGFFEADELALIVEHDLWTVVHAIWQLEAIEQAQLGKPLTVWLKLDTGMHRVGLHPSEYRAAYQRLLATGKVARVVLMSHFSCADELNSACSDQQVAVFEAARQGLVAETSLKNSPAVMGWPKIPSDWSRTGIMLYGATPFDQTQPLAERLQPVMTLESKVISVRELPAGEAVGYGATFVSERPLRIGVVAMGYADGYPRHAPTGTPVLIDGQRSRLLGRVSMDMLCVDLTDVPQAGLGSRVELWGKAVLASEVATQAGTIPYQIFCNLRRVPRIYSEN
ncbi:MULTISPECIES: alanine racemase [Pseudomonas syringae group]|uniref:Alanine racemase n=2 Tax=Pseudomonas syringae group genomosp. 3 TaxID=251701 RepID=Q88BB4_PSESM|nr:MULTISPECIES: alanine racemase [Pseudomonas syringae group]KPC07802.1 Alanine racemase [Pseudomonas amygdali pv. lachrymans]AAO53657.1 alanine racemase, catabolic [Pseudomonas syringae pv. tomato str. DC3000]EGH98592.1 alanine racemase [Pseudomonas amygdali pv. lachrymans str. M302278]KKI25084.1 alanine racemase [Pseudomonas syringae pv. persicae]KPB95140.1 Alanine racemase [Pseudomonas syringae pv. maculicola]